MEVLPSARMVDPPPKPPPDKPCPEKPLILSSPSTTADLGQSSKSSPPASDVPPTVTGNGVALQSASMVSNIRPQSLPLKAASDMNFQTFKSSSPVTNQPPATTVQHSSAAILDLMSHPDQQAILVRSMSAPSLAMAVAKLSGPTANTKLVDSTVRGNSKPSFVDVAKNNSTKKTLPLFGQPPALPGASLISKDGKDILMFDDESTRQLSEPFKWALVGKFSHGVPEINNLGKFFLKLKLEGDFDLRWLSNRQVLVVFSLERDYTRMWLQGIWHIDRCPMRLLKWTPYFNEKIESAIVPVWVKLSGLPVHLYDKRALFHIASQLGKPILADDPTASRTRLSFARFCVEIDLLEHLKDNIVIGINGKIFEQPVVYENVPKYCSFCKHIGHEVLECYIKSVELKPPQKSKEKSKAFNSGQQQLDKGVLVDKDKQKQGKGYADKFKPQQFAKNGHQGGLSDKKKTKVLTDSRLLGFHSSNQFQALDSEEGDDPEILEDGEVKAGQDDSLKMKDLQSLQSSAETPSVQQSASQGEGKEKHSLVPAQVQASTPTTSPHTGHHSVKLKPQCSIDPPETSSPFCHDRRLVLAASQSAPFNPQQLVTYTTPPTRPAAKHPFNSIYPTTTPPLPLHEFFIPDMDVARVSYHQALDMVAEREYVGSDDEFDGNSYESDDDFKELALHRSCSTPDFKQRNKRGAFSSGYGGRITRSMAKFC